MDNILTRLQDWYRSQCDGDWERQYGIKINTLDNPGWQVQIELNDTPLKSAAFTTVEDRYEDDVEWAALLEGWPQVPRRLWAKPPGRCPSHVFGLGGPGIADSPANLNQ
jgi:hypothetical protein